MTDFGPLPLVRRARWTLEEGRVVLEVPKFGAMGTRVLRMIRAPPMARLRLDALSTRAWLEMEGRTGAELLDRLAEEFPDEPALPERLGQFLGLLEARGLVDAGPAES